MRNKPIIRMRNKPIKYISLIILFSLIVTVVSAPCRSEAAIGQDNEAATGQDSEAAVGQDNEVATGQDSEAAVNQDNEAVTGQDSEAAEDTALDKPDILINRYELPLMYDVSLYRLGERFIVYGYHSFSHYPVFYSIDVLKDIVDSLTFPGMAEYGGYTLRLTEDYIGFVNSEDFSCTVYDKYLNRVRTFAFPENYYGTCMCSADLSTIYYFDNDGLLSCYNTGDGSTTELWQAKHDYYSFLDEDFFEDNYCVFSDYNIDGSSSEASWYYKFDSGEVMGLYPGRVVYRFSPDRSEYIGVTTSPRTEVALYDSVAGDEPVFPESGFSFDPQDDSWTAVPDYTGPEAKARMALTSTSEIYNYFVDWAERAFITVTTDYYRGDNFYSFCCYNIDTGRVRSKTYFKLPFGSFSQFEQDIDSHTIGFYGYDSDNSIMELCTWDYLSENITDPDDYFLKFTYIPEDLDAYRKELEDKYDINIYLASEVFSVTLDYRLTLCTDFDAMKEALDVIDSTFELYPKDLFEQIRFGGIRTLGVYLCSGFTNITDAGISNAIALASTLDYERALAIDVNYMYDLPGTIVHELSHWIDNRINLEADFGRFTDFEETWCTLNPDDFYYKYSYVSGKNFYNYVFDENTPESSYFIDTYGQTWPTEDRARLFEYLMFNTSDTQYMSSPVMREKLHYYFSMIREVFDDSDWPEQTSWEARLAECDAGNYPEPYSYYDEKYESDENASEGYYDDFAANNSPFTGYYDSYEYYDGIWEDGVG